MEFILSECFFKMRERLVFSFCAHFFQPDFRVFKNVHHFRKWSKTVKKRKNKGFFQNFGKTCSLIYFIWLYNTHTLRSFSTFYFYDLKMSSKENFLNQIGFPGPKKLDSTFHHFGFGKFSSFSFILSFCAYLPFSYYICVSYLPQMLLLLYFCFSFFLCFSILLKLLAILDFFLCSMNFSCRSMSKILDCLRGFPFFLFCGWRTNIS